MTSDSQYATIALQVNSQTVLAYMNVVLLLLASTLRREPVPQHSAPSAQSVLMADALTAPIVAKVLTLQNWALPHAVNAKRVIMLITRPHRDAWLAQLVSSLSRARGSVQTAPLGR